jgi:transposase
VPTEAEEGVRDLVRCREDMRAEIIRWRHRTLKLLARHGRIYQAGRNWSQRHWRWIRDQQFEDPALGRAFAASLFALEQALVRQADLDQELATLAATDRYRAPVAALRCFRGLDPLSAMILLAEITDFARLRRPRQLMAYVGLVPSEYFSGERQRRGAITKAGNTHARRVLVEGSGRPWPPAAPVNRRPWWRRPGAPNSGCIGATATWSATASGRPLRSSPSRGSYSASSGQPCDHPNPPRRRHDLRHLLAEVRRRGAATTGEPSSLLCDARSCDRSDSRS